MSSLISAMIDFIRIGLFLGALLTLCYQVKIELLAKLTERKPNLTSYTEKMTGAALDLSHRRVYGK